MIFTINTNGYALYPVAKTEFKMSDKEVYDMINHEFSVLASRLEKKGVRYDELKRALTPNQDKNNNEVCLVFDSNQIDSSVYGHEVFKKLIPLLDKNSTYSILAGDFIDIMSEVNNSQQYLFRALKDVITECNASEYQNSNQYYLVYFSSITSNQLLSITDKMQKYKWFYGYAFVNSNSPFKTYLSYILSHVCVKSKSTVIASHPSDYDDTENVNMAGYPFEDNGFRFISINEGSFGPFLSYKIESVVPDRDDVSFSFNALFPKFDSLDKLKLNILDGKWKYLNGDSNGKGGILSSFALDNVNKDDFCKIVFDKICNNYIYNLRTNEYGDNLFNACIELPTKNNNIRKTTIALKYHPDYGQIDIVTIT